MSEDKAEAPVGDSTANDNTQVTIKTNDVAGHKSAPGQDIQTTRTRWTNRYTFVNAAVGAAIGLGNVWKFPYLTFKHGGPTFILTYILAVFVIGIPMLILELTLGQKMQRGSAGSMRGIVPRLAGFGWVASFAGFVVSLSYNVLLGLVAIYLIGSGSTPWSSDNLVRVPGCATAEMAKTSSEEIYLYNQVVKLYGDRTCEPWKPGQLSNFATPLFISTLINWLLIGTSLFFGPRLIEYKAVVTVPLRFLLLIIFVIKFAGLNSSVNGDGIGYYMGQNFPLPPDGSGKTSYMTFENVASSLFPDAYIQVLFSISVCYGTMFAYGSYNRTKKPVIQDSLIIIFLDFLFAFIAGFGVWGGIGYL